MSGSTQEPMIYTSKGNLPLSQLREEVHWLDTPDETTCAVEHWLGEECVKRAIHIFYRKKTILAGTAGVI